MMNASSVRAGFLARAFQLCLALVLALWFPTGLQAAQEAGVSDLQFIDDDRLSSILQNEGKGKVVIVTFFASWCGPCREEIPQLVRLRDNTPEENLLILGVNFDHSLEALNRFLQRARINFPVYIGESNVFTSNNKLVEIRAIPRMFVYDASGNQVQDIEGVLPEAVFDRMADYLLESAI